MKADISLGQQMHDLATELFPINRSLTGNGNRQTLDIIGRQGLETSLMLYEVPSGTKCFDWEVPDEWNCKDAFLKGSKRYADIWDSNLHVVGYSVPVARSISLQELQPHLHSRPDMPDAIPYVTSYYKREWGFCLSHEVRKTMKDRECYAFIDSTLEPGHMTYAHMVIPGQSDLEVLLSTYICHPSMGNNELSGPVVTTFLAKWLMSEPRRFTYRIVFVPETIGSIYYISRHLDHLKKKVVAGFQVTCVGDDRCYSYLPSRNGNTWSDRVAEHVLVHSDNWYDSYKWSGRGSDERQWCAPGVDLPIASVMRSKYGTYPEYHTSKDDLSFITPTGLEGGYTVLKQCIEALECDYRYVATHKCEPQMGRRGLYKDEHRDTRMDILTWCDGKHSLLDIANKIGQPIASLQPLVKELLAHNLIKGSNWFVGRNQRADYKWAAAP